MHCLGGAEAEGSAHGRDDPEGLPQATDNFQPSTSGEEYPHALQINQSMLQLTN